MSMTKPTQLFIRACKSKHPLQRVGSVYRRFYLNTDEDISQDVASILTRICELHVDYKLSDIVSDLNPINDWKIDPVGSELEEALSHIKPVDSINLSI